MFSRFEKMVDVYPATTPAYFPKTLLQFIFKCTQGVRRPIVMMMVCTAMIGALEAWIFSMLGALVDWLSHIEPSQLWAVHHLSLIQFTALLVAIPLIVMVQALFKYQALFGNFPMRLRWHFHRLMLNQSLAFFHNEFSGRITAKVMQTALAVLDIVTSVGDVLIYFFIYLISVGIVLASFDSWLLLPFLGWIVLYGTNIFFFVPRLAKVSGKQADARSLMTGRINDAYINISTVKLFSHSQREAGYARAAMQEWITPIYAQGRVIACFQVTNHALSMLLIMTTTATALWLWIQGHIGAGSVAAAAAMTLRFNGMSHWMMWEIATLFERVGMVRDGMSLLSHPQLVLDKPDAKVLKISEGKIDFQAVCFAYDNQQRVLDHFSLHINPGEKVGLVGRSGSGKSTLFNALVRFYDIEQGSIYIDGQNIVSVTQESLRSQIGMVTQDNALLHRSIRENILYGRPDATEDEMITAAKQAQAHTFIQTLVDAQGRRGYDAHVGERGVKLSGGQRQRITIARVLLKDSPILLLDEATSALDSEVEIAIQASFYQMMQGKTVIAIAHRLSTIAAMDRLIVLDRGRIIESGSHAQLLENNGLYAQLWAHQSGGFLGDVARSHNFAHQVI